MQPNLPPLTLSRTTNGNRGRNSCEPIYSAATEELYEYVFHVGA